MKNLIANTALLALFVSANAFAGIVTYNATPFTGLTDFTHLSALPLWNPALFPGQTLLSAQITLDVSENPGLFTITNNANIEEGFTVKFASVLVTSGGVVLADVPSLAELFLYGPQAMFLAASGGTTCTGPTVPGSGTPCSIFQFNPGSIGPGPVSGPVDSTAGNLVLYTGSGTFNVSTQTLADTGFIGGGNNLTLTASNQGTVLASVTYTYAASGAPEPATMALFGSALIGLGLLGRKRLSR